MNTSLVKISRPCCRYAAEFFGCRNILPARKTGDAAACEIGTVRLPKQLLPNGDVLLCIRSESIMNIGSGMFTGIIEKIMPRSTDRLCTLRCGSSELEFVIRYGEALEPGQYVRFDLDTSGVCCVPFPSSAAHDRVP